MDTFIVTFKNSFLGVNIIPKYVCSEFYNTSEENGCNKKFFNRHMSL